jgi:galactokinase/mevalonate kinase-like predicted kinase
MTDRDEVAELADRLLAKQRRGEELGVEFEIEFGALTDEERDDFVALMDERAAHGKEKLEAIEATNGALKALLRLLVSSDAPPGTTLGQALVAGYISVLEVVEAVRTVPDPLAGRQ